MTTFVKPTAKGQVTIRKTLMQHMRLRPGQRLELRPTADGNILLVPEKPGHDISAIFGMLARPHGSEPNDGRDPTERDNDQIGAYLVAEDDRTRS